MKRKLISDCEITAPSQYAAPLNFLFSDVVHCGNYKAMSQEAVWVCSESVSFYGFNETANKEQQLKVNWAALSLLEVAN